MYRGINGTPSALLLEPPPPPSTASPPTASLFSLSRSSFRLVFLLALLLPPIPSRLSNSLSVRSPTILSLSPFLRLSITCIRAHVYLSVFLPVAGSRSPSYDLPRSTTTFVFASAQHTSQIGSRATLYPTLVCTAGRSTRGGWLVL